MRHMARVSSMKQKEIVSRRWSVIKDMNCINVSGNGTSSRKNVTSLNCLPFRGPDEIMMTESDAERKSESASSDKSESKLNSIQMAVSNKQMPSIHSLESNKEEKKEKAMVVLEKLEEVEE